MVDLWISMIALVGLLVIGWLRGHHQLDAPHAFAVVFLTVLAAVLAVVLNHRLITPPISRARPCHTTPQLANLLACTRSSPMHGDHAVIVGALTAGLLVLSRRLGAIAVGLALVLALGRVYVGAQNPPDTAVGLALGAGIALSMLTLTNCVSALVHRLSHIRVHGSVG